MRLYLHPNERDDLPVEIILSPDEAERWIAQLQSGVRNVREGRGEQMMLLGEPARVVLSVQERPDGPRPEGSPRPFPHLTPAAIPHLDVLVAMSQAGIAVMLALIVVGLFLLLAFRMMP